MKKVIEPLIKKIKKIEEKSWKYGAAAFLIYFL